jgi:ABC-2 type transport system ATP-binding protein
MRFWADLYGVPHRRGEELLRRVALDPDRGTPVRDYSTGMRQRLVIARSLVNEPELLFLDEPTRGLDPASARTLRGIVRELIETGTTVCLTTHDMAEAEELCDTIAIMDHGRIVAQGSPDELRSAYGGSERPGARVRLDDGSTFHLDLAEPSDRERLADLARTDRIASVHTTEPSLTDVFVGLVGQPPDAATELEP